MNTEEFGVCKDGRMAYLYTICNNNGMSAKITDYGATIVSLYVKDKEGELRDVVLGYDTLAEYENGAAYFGAAIGRCANRIRHGLFSLEGETVQLNCNDGENHLHGGFAGFDKKVWSAEQTDENSLKLTLFSPDGDEHYPGNLIACVRYTITEDNALEMSYSTFSDRKTICNMTNHSYFNLSGQDSDSILEHELRISANEITKVGDGLISTGELIPVEGTPMDFRELKRIGEDIRSDHPQIQFGSGYDVNFVLNKDRDCPAAEVFCAESGICMRVFTDMPGIQLYTGNYLNDNYTLKGNRKAAKHCALCLETQYFPNAVNHSGFKSPVIQGGENLQYATRYIFSIR